MNALTAQENKAKDLQATYQQNQQQTQVSEFEERENNSIREDLTKLQNEDKLPKLLDASAPGFSEDTATKEVQSVLDFMNQQNTAALERYNKGGAYSHITFEQAYNMMPKNQEKQAQQQRQAQEDTERTQKASKVAGNQGNDGGLNIQKPTVKQGITLDQIADRIDNEW